MTGVAVVDSEILEFWHRRVDFWMDVLQDG